MSLGAIPTLGSRPTLGVGDFSVAVAGHACLDVIPEVDVGVSSLAELLRPGTLVNVGRAVTATGGCVANTGVALARLGTRVELMSRVGDDMFGRALLDVLRRAAPDSLSGMRVAHGEPTSYTIVLSAPGVDRVFLHCGGTNHTFGADDVDLERVAPCHTLHFGYPPLMRRVYESPEELTALFRSARALGVTTSLDMSRPDESSDAARVDWPRWLAAVLPEVDVFAPSLDEMRLLLDRDRSAALPSADELRALADRLIALGARIVGLKLGERGLYLRTTRDARSLERLGRGAPVDPDAWCDRDLCVPCFQANVVGTTGAGDSTIAGLLTALGAGFDPERTLTAAVGVGGCSVEAADANSAVPRWEIVQVRIAGGWPRREERIPGFSWNSAGTLAVGSADAAHRGETC